MQEEDNIKLVDDKCHLYTTEYVVVVMMRLPPHCSEERRGDYIEVVCFIHECRGPRWHKTHTSVFTYWQERGKQCLTTYACGCLTDHCITQG